MRFSKIFKLLTLFAFVAVVLFSKPVYATQINIFSSPDSIIVKVQEAIEYVFTLKIENKVAVLEKHAEKRLVTAQDYTEEGNKEKVQNLLQNYLQIKEKQNSLLQKTDGAEVLEKIAEKTIEQQKIMEEIKTKTDEGTKQKVIQVQERVVNQVAKQVVEVNGPEGATEFLNKVVHVWAPGTGPGEGEAGVVYEGGGKLMYAPGTGPGGQGGVVIDGGEMKFAPGTSSGGPSGADIKTVEIKTGGGENNLAPGTTSGEATTPENRLAPGTSNTIDEGSHDFAPGTSAGGETGIAP